MGTNATTTIAPAGKNPCMIWFLCLLALLVLVSMFAVGVPHLPLQFGDQRSYEDLVDKVVRKRMQDLERENDAKVQEAVRQAKKGLVKDLLKGSALQNAMPQSIQREMQRVKNALETCGHPKVAEMFARTYMSTISTTVELTNTGDTYVITGDIEDEWIRDSACQLHPYIPLAKDDPHVQLLVEGAIRQQMFFLRSSPYANAFNIKWKANPSKWEKGLGRGGYVATYNYELDSLAYFLRLSYQYWQHSGGVYEGIFDTGDWFHTVDMIVNQMIVEQRHEENSTYRYKELPRGGLGSPVGWTGMTWTGYRPSDDRCKYHYLIPANAFAHVELGHALEMLRELLDNLGVPRAEVVALQHRIAVLRLDIDTGIFKYGVVDHPKYGKIYAYEVDGLGGQNLMDDANVPSLLSLQYLNYTSLHDPFGQIFRNTRRFVLSKDNPYYFEGKSLTGVGSPHTKRGNVWPMSVIIQAMTTSDKAEAMGLLEKLTSSDASTGYMHESEDASTPQFYTRKWFAWANALFAELVMQRLPDICSAPAFGRENEQVPPEKTRLYHKMPDMRQEFAPPPEPQPAMAATAAEAVPQPAASASLAETLASLQSSSEKEKQRASRSQILRGLTHKKDA
mmetsp:Transcript_22845/g.53421  ORF Transcript_22845/g.53421 Transcript_22845/m.53421 type:complete len:620 (+) Transcript_22845:158-2017(+)|eukprot:CAMPEP_0178415094 /NCGR_PEP_ID=MMETSP0689_2-20121128/23374_1 /TAXON_ID=160604 /ORGANISM="Amphidinium massartii, Strain CS-259" /LENGTH=619 /DNA_ID=CAMNT_0020036403 /DNA_START=68 /DNA_END=1927 /DNA_ORIENTATION=-